MCEYGRPHELLCNTDSMLLKLVDKTGLTESERLKKIAYDSSNIIIETEL